MNTRIRSLRFSSAFVLAIAFCGTTSAQTPQYSIKKIGPIPGHNGSIGNAINNAGQIAGSSDTITAYRWSAGTLDAMPPLSGGTVTRAEGIAEDGSVLGSSYTTSGGLDHATVWFPSGSGYSATDLGVGPGDIFSLALAMNAGLIVGLSDDAIDWKPAVWLPPAQDPGNYTIQMLPMLSGDYGGIAFDVNASGVVVGTSANGGTAHPTKWTLSGGTWTVTNLGALGTNAQSEAWAINASGTAVGYSYSPAAVAHHAVLWNSGGIVDLGALQSGWRAFASGINDGGDIVGTSGPSGLTTAWVRPASLGAMLDLNACLPPASLWTLIRAEDINNGGQITGYGDLSGFGQSFLLTPISTFLAGPVPGTVGQNNTITVTGATPGATVRFAIGTVGGETQISGCPSSNLDIAGATTLGNSTADASGTAMLTFFGRPSMAGLTFLFQALDVASCRVTNVTQVTF
jgi:uncharacterized membrane protein